MKKIHSFLKISPPNIETENKWECWSKRCVNIRSDYVNNLNNSSLYQKFRLLLLHQN